MSQIDMLDNLVLGSTPEGYANSPSAGGYAVDQALRLRAARCLRQHPGCRPPPA